MKQRRIFRTKDVISSQLRSTVETYYPIGNIRTVSVLEGGYWNKLFHLKSENRDIVLRLSHPTTTLEGIAYEHALMRFMSQHIPEVPAPLVAHDGSTYF
jgi:Ser/Thr protein kinase RdoA (MazF antagonist)